MVGYVHFKYMHLVLEGCGVHLHINNMDPSKVPLSQKFGRVFPISQARVPSVNRTANIYWRLTVSGSLGGDKNY